MVGGKQLGNSKGGSSKKYFVLQKKRGLTRKALAEKLGVSASAVINWEYGKNSIDMDTLHTLCEVLNVDIMDMFGECANILDYKFSEEEKGNI